MSMSKVTEYRLKDTVVSRKLPMTQEGSDNIRKIREYMVREIKNRRGEDVKLSIPAVIHLMAEDYIKLKGVK